MFLPYYSLEIVNAQCQRFHFNVARENTTGSSRELSVWHPTSRFIDQCHFGTLELPFQDFTAFHWRLKDLELKSTPSANGTLQVLAGTVSSGDNGEISLQATARHDGKIVALNHCETKTDGRTAFQMPLNVGESGSYQVTVTGRTKDGKVLHHLQELPMEAVAFKIKMNNPIYRRSFFPDQEDKTLSLTVDYQTDDGELLEKAKTQFSITGPDGGSVAFGENLSGRFRTFTAVAGGKIHYNGAEHGACVAERDFAGEFPGTRPCDGGQQCPSGQGEGGLSERKAFLPPRLSVWRQPQGGIL